jgi:hypothetical protein
MKTTSTFALLLGLVAAAGCGDDADKPPPYVNVTGTVTYNDKPLDKGQITFTVPGRPPVTLDVVNGKFAGQAMAGDNRVSVVARRKAAGKAKSKLTPEMEKRIKQMSETMSGGGGAPPPDHDPDSEDYIPPEWGKASKQVRVIAPGQDNNLQFDIRGGK